MPEINTDQQIGGEDNPIVLAYRVGQLERSNREGFKNLSDKLDVMSCTYATHKDIDVVRAQAKLEHQALSVEIKDVKEDVEIIKSQKWVQNTLSGVLGAVLALLITYAFNNIF